MTVDPQPAAQLVESDCRYFEAGATLRDLDGAVMTTMPGLEPVLGASVVQRVDPRAIHGDPADWVAEVVDQFSTLGCAAARVYLLEGDGPLAGALSAAGFRKRVEIGYAATSLRVSGTPAVSLRPVEGDDGWEQKRKLHSGAEVAADGHAIGSDDWVELERRKCEGGEMRPFFIEVDGDVCGGVCTLDVGELLRAKNVFVRPEHRRTGIATATMSLLAQRAQSSGNLALGVFGVPGNPGNAVYERLGMRAVVRQYEWMLRLPA